MRKEPMILVVVLLIVVAVIIIFLLTKSSDNNIPMNNGYNQNTGNNNEATGNINSENLNNSDSDNQNSQPTTHTIDISGFAFNTKTLTVKVGDTITWTNKDSIGHTVTSDSGSELNSQLLSKDQTYSHTFNTLGEYDYHCTPHPYMKGKVIVE